MHRLARTSALTVALLTACLAALSGCQQELRPNQLAEASAAYQAGEYPSAYRDATAIARTEGAPGRDEAALVAGLAAQQLGRWDAAERFLLQAAFSEEPSIAGDALASLGLMYAQREQYTQSAEALLKAAPRLSGENRANAYFYAGVAQQKLGQSAQARTTFYLAREATNDPVFRQRIEEQLAVSGYTLQLGAFGDPDNARAFAEELASQAADARLGTPRVVQSTDRDGGPISVVQVGQFSTFSSAMEARDRLGISEIVIVPLAGR